MRLNKEQEKLQHDVEGTHRHGNRDQKKVRIGKIVYFKSDSEESSKFQSNVWNKDVRHDGYNKTFEKDLLIPALLLCNNFIFLPCLTPDFTGQEKRQEKLCQWRIRKLVRINYTRDWLKFKIPNTWIKILFV